MANLKYIGKNILNHDLILKKGNVSGSASSTGSFGNLNISSDASITGDMVVGGKLTAEEFHTEITSASIIFASGSTLFGDTQDDIHRFTGSLKITGSVTAINLTADSSSVSTRLTTEEGNVDALQTDSGSFSTRVTNLKADSGSFSTRTTTLEAASASFSTRVTTAETELELTLISGSAQLASQISGAFTDGFEFDGTISGSATSTGSFGRVEITSGKVLGDSTGGVTTPFSVIGGTGTSAGGLQFGAYDALFGGIWPTNVTPASSNYALVAKGSRTVLNSTTDIGLYKDDATVLLFANSTGVAIGGDSTNPTKKLDVIGTGRFTGDLTLGGNLVGDDATNISGVNDITALGDISGSATSTGSFGSVKTVGDITATTGNIKTQNSRKLQAFRNAGQYVELYSDPNGFNYLQPFGGALRFAPNGGTKMILHTNGRLGLNTTVDAGYLLDVNGTGRFSDTLEATHFSGSQFTGIFNGALSGSAQIASNISGAFAVASASFASDINDLQADSASFSTRVTNLKTDSGSFSTRITTNSSSFAARDTLSEATSSKILNGQLEFTNITGSGHISMSLSSTGSFGRVSATTIGGHSPLIVDSNTTFTNSITGSGHVSASISSTGSFGHLVAKSISGHQSLLINTPTTASSTVQFDGKIFIETGSIEGDLHIRTNDDFMRIGKSTSGLFVSGSETISRFATGSDGSIIDLGFTTVDEDGNTVLAGDGDGIHLDGNNYWYNNKYYKVGDGSRNFLRYDTSDGIRYKGKVIAQTGSFGGEMFINSPTGSMFIGKFTGGIPTSGSDTISRFATGSDGSIIDLGFTTTNEEGETVFLTTGDGVVVDANNYWYTTGHFKVGNDDKSINWDTNNLTLTKVTASGDFFVQGDSYVQEYIYHKGDNDTFLRFAPNLVNLAAGGKSAIKYEASTGKIIINNSNANVDFHVMADNGEEILATDAANNRVGINTTTPSTALHVVGDATITGKLTAQELHTEIESASVIFTSGSTIFGNSIDDTHTFTGSMFLTGSISASVFRGDGSQLTGITSFAGSAGTETIFSGSATSTGSFGKILGDGSDISNLPVSAINNATENRLVTIGATTSELDAESTLTFNGTQLDLSSAGHATVHITGASGKDANLKLQNNSRLWIFQNDGDNTLFGGGGALHLYDGTAGASRIIVDSTGVIETPMGVSGSSTSTGSFGKLLGDGSSLTNLPASDAFPFTGSATISGSFTVDTGDGKLFNVSNETGSLFSVTDAAGIPALETFDDNRTVGRFQRPMRKHVTNFTASVFHGGYYNIVGGNLTCSIVHPNTASVAIGTEFEFFQTSSVGNMLFETGSTGTTQLLVKNGNVRLAGQYSGATLKKVDTDTWHLVGDLT